ncbi:hypothetical protein CPB85DRAFT_1500350 [Mucidula mucida]|nr:hypothetical protein CPB85DRAFT_1500350 [Mucidula mucida]
MIACIGGTPKDVARWTSEVVEPLEKAIEEGSRGVKFSKKEKRHKRGPFAATAIGVSHGVVRRYRPGNRRLSKGARKFMEGLLSNPAVQCASGFLNHMFYLLFPCRHIRGTSATFARLESALAQELCE